MTYETTTQPALWQWAGWARTDYRGRWEEVCASNDEQHCLTLLRSACGGGRHVDMLVLPWDRDPNNRR